MLVRLFDFMLRHLPTSGEVDRREGWANTVFEGELIRFVRISFERLDQPTIRWCAVRGHTVLYLRG